MSTSSLVADFDHHDPALTWDTVFDVYAEIRERQQVTWSDAHGGFWVLTRYDDVLAALRDHRTFSSAQGVHLPRPSQQPMIIPIDFDPPEHRHYRRLFEPILDAAVVERHGEAIESLIRDLVGAAVARGRVDLIGAVAVPLPLQVLSILLGVSRETTSQLRALTARWWEEAAHQDRSAAAATLTELMLDEVRERRRTPRADYLTWLDAAEVAGRPITEEEVAGVLLTLAVAGHETTVNTAGSMMRHLAEHPSLRTELRDDRSKIPAVVEELLRLHTPAQLFARTLTRDAEVGGVTMRTGDKVMLVLAAANHDPVVFPRPREVVLDREVSRHLAFGWGVHHCVGAHLARRELRLLLDVLCDAPPFRIDGEVVATPLIGGHHLGVHQLPVAFA